jgi:hypothetical protein
MNIFFYHDYIYNQYFILEIKTDLSYDGLISFLKLKTKQNLSPMGIFTIINKEGNKYFFDSETFLSDLKIKQQILDRDNDISSFLIKNKHGVITKNKMFLELKTEDLI